VFYFLKSDWFKLLLALILAVLFGLLYYAKWSATIQEKEFDAQKKAHPTASNVSFNNYELKEVDEHYKTRWLLNAKTGTIQRDTKDVALTEISMKFFDGDKIKMHVTAPVGSVNQKSMYVCLSSGPGQKVTALGMEGKSCMEMEKLELEKKNQFKASGGVNIAMGVAKVTGDHATGRFAGTSFQDVKIIGNTHAIIASDVP